MESSHINLSVSGRITQRLWQQDSHKPPTVGFETSSPRFIPILRSISQAKSSRSYLYSGTSGRLLCFMEIAGAKCGGDYHLKQYVLWLDWEPTRHIPIFPVSYTLPIQKYRLFHLQTKIFTQRLAPLATIVLRTVISSLLDHLLANTDHLPELSAC